MIPHVSYCSSSFSIINNFTLQFKNQRLNRDYIQDSYHFAKYLSYTIYQFIIAVLIFITAINYCNTYGTRLDVILLCLATITFVMTVVALIVLCSLHKNHSRRGMVYYTMISVHTVILVLIAFMTRILILVVEFKPEIKEQLYMVVIAFYLFNIIFYALIIESNFAITMIITLVFFAVIFTFEFLIEELSSSLFFYPLILLVRSLIYFVERRDKLLYYYIRKINIIYEVYGNFSNRYNIASFTNDDHCFLNTNFIDFLSTVTHSKEIKRLKSFDYYSKDFEINTSTCTVPQSLLSFMKIKCFTRLSMINDILPSELKSLITKIQEDDLGTIDAVISFIRKNGYLFNKMTFIGEKTSVYYPDKHFLVNILYSEKYDSVLCFSAEKTTEDTITKLQGDDQLQKFSLFASKITHDIKNPLQAVQKIISNIQTSIIKKEPQQVLFEKLNTINNYSHYMMIIAKDFECFAKKLLSPKAEKIFDIDYQKVDIRKIIQFSCDLIRMIKSEFKVSWHIEIDDDVEQFVYSDDIRLKQILINILSNSVKFTKIGDVYVKCSNSQEENDHVIISIKDTGFGMRKEDLDKLNNDGTVFYKTSINNSLGSGLGLNIVKSLVKLLGKDFKMMSEINKGTTVSFLIKKNKKMMPGGNRPSIITNNNNTINPTNSITIQMSESACKFINEEEDSFKTKRVDFNLVKPPLPNNLVSTLVKSSTTNSNPNQIKDQLHESFKRSQTNYRSTLFYERVNASKQDYEIFHACSYKRNEEEPTEKQSQNAIVDNSDAIRIIVVEDEHTIRNSQVNLIKTYCSRKNIKVVIEECMDGFECLYKIYQGFSENHKYACVLTDDSMKFLSGNFTAYILRTLVLDKAIYPMKIYMCSGTTFPRQSVEGMNNQFDGNAFFDGSFSKPLNMNNIETVFNLGFY